MPNPLGSPMVEGSATRQGFFGRLIKKENIKKAFHETVEVVTPPKEMFAKPSAFVEGLFSHSAKVEDTMTSDALGVINKQFGAKAEIAVQGMEAKKPVAKVVGGLKLKIVDFLLGGKSAENDELPPARKFVTPDGRTVFIREGDLDALKLAYDPRAREGRPPLPSPLDPANTYDRPSPPAHPVIPPTTSALPVPAIQDPVAVARPNDKQPEPPGRPVLVRFIDP